MRIRLFLERGLVVLLFCGAAAIGSPAQTLTTLVSFDGTDGRNLNAPLIQGTDGNFYGVTENGGTIDFNGTIFKLTPTGTLTTLYDFQGKSDGNTPVGGLVQTRNGAFYGTTFVGGNGIQGGYGGVFKFQGQTFTSLFQFTYSQGANPTDPPIQALDGNLYGAAESGGINDVNCFFGSGCGTIFKVTPAGVPTVLYSFCSQSGCPDGWSPSGGLMQASDGNLYGLTFSGGNYNAPGCLASAGCGTIFKITPKGAFTMIHAFQNSDGANPYDDIGLLQASDGNFYGTTWTGGLGNQGTVFKMTPQGSVTLLHSFCPNTLSCDGMNPAAGLIQATDGNLYGTTYTGGAYNSGIVFQITPQGALTTLYSFCATSGCPDGSKPFGALMQSANGKLYGTTQGGGAFGSYGTVFSLDMGLGSFIITRPTTGKSGEKVTILGYKLGGSSSVTFNGVAATFTVVSSTNISAVVPAGATSGPVVVTTPAGKLTSNKRFTIK